MKKIFKNKLEEAEFEIEELAMQLADMLGIAIHYAGVKDNKMPQAIDAYLALSAETIAINGGLRRY